MELFKYLARHWTRLRALIGEQENAAPPALTPTPADSVRAARIAANSVSLPRVPK
jgi:hypothetical protein